MRNRPTNWLEEVEGQYKGGSLEARMNHLQVEMEEVMKLRQVSKYRGRHKGEGEKEQCPRCTYKKHKAGQKCPAEERTCNTCGGRGHFGMSKMCKKKKKDVRRVKKEKKESTSEDSNTEEEMEVNRVVRDKVWPGTSSKARKRNVRYITLVNSKDEGAGRVMYVKGEGAGCVMYAKDEGEGRAVYAKGEGTGRDVYAKDEGMGRDVYAKDEATGREKVARRIKGGGKRASRWVKMVMGGEELDLYCDTGSNITIITPDMYKESMGKVVAAKSYLRAWGSDNYLPPSPSSL